MDKSITAQSLDLDNLTGSRKQIEWADKLRDAALQYIWQGWYGTHEDFEQDMKKLPTDADWWIDNRTVSDTASASSHDAARRFLGLIYVVPAGADY